MRTVLIAKQALTKENNRIKPGNLNINNASGIRKEGIIAEKCRFNPINLNIKIGYEENAERASNKNGRSLSWEETKLARCVAEALIRDSTSFARNTVMQSQYGKSQRKRKEYRRRERKFNEKDKTNLKIAKRFRKLHRRTNW